MMNIAFLASHNGSAARAITEACLDGRLIATPSLLVSNNAGSNAITWAKDLKVKTAVINAANTQDTDQAIADLFTDNNIDIVVFSGYMKLVGPKTIAAAHGALLNTHPALLPKYGGKGMYGRHVHEAVYQSGETETGITIHLVDGEYDTGRILAQKKIPIPPGSNTADIEEMVKTAEPDFYIETLQKILSGDLSLR
jgi:phosphoribosylglycinamide formyltransferase-1